MNSELEEELKAARELQMSLLPREFPSLPGYQLAARFLPAKEVGGDFYDFIKIGDSAIGILIGDVAGKGIPAAIMMSAARNTFSLLAQGVSSPETVILTSGGYVLSLRLFHGTPIRPAQTGAYLPNL